ncbi:MAG: MATE family efflux transporter [Ignavibacteriae bacterium HGW-Ignavibacteriae-4]|nr:MAG: MATE family efflux transporter [Ignavibacteriae bacterium HGW-Ignavibacteriae-4]
MKEVKAKENRAKFTSGDVGKQLLFGAIPMTIGIGAAIGFNFVDTVFIAKLGVKQLAAITYTFPMVFVVIGIAMGLGIGATAVISKAIGEGDDHRVKRLATDSIILALIVTAITIIVGIIFLDPLFKSMGADESTMVYIREYMYIWLPGTIFLIVPMVGNYTIRATGDIKTPSYIMLVAVGINIILDPIFIFGLGPIPAMGIQGAAIATLIGRLVTLVVAFRLLYYKYDMITFELPSFKEMMDSWKEILHVGLPTAASNVILPAGFGIIIDFTSDYGEAAVAALGAASRIESLVLTVFMATAAVLSPFIGQNWGALKFDRIDKAFKIAFTFCFVWGAAMIGFFELFKEPISWFVKSDPDVVEVMVLYLSITPFAMAFRGILMICTTSLNVLKRPLESAALTIGYMFIFFVPLAYFGSKYYGLLGIFWSLVIGAVTTAIIGYYTLKHRYAQIKVKGELLIEERDVEVAIVE